MATNPIGVINAIVTNLSAASVLGTVNVAKDYSVIDKTQNPCAVVGFRDATVIKSAFGGLDDINWSYMVELFVKDTGSASAVMDTIITTSGKILDSLRSDKTLQGTVADISEISGERVPGEAFATGTATLYKTDFVINALEWPDG